MMHSQGWGLTTSFTKFNTFKKRRLFTIDFVSIKDPKEVKVSAINDRNAKSFVYGKLNYIYNLRTGIGFKNTLYQPLRENGIRISTTYSIGPTLAFQKPVYLEVFKVINKDEYEKVTEKYDPEFHTLNEIYGRAAFRYGLNELKVVPGLAVKLGLNFEKEISEDTYRMIEVGVAVDAYPKRIPIMKSSNENFVFTTLYLNLLLSRKYY